MHSLCLHSHVQLPIRNCTYHTCAREGEEEGEEEKGDEQDCAHSLDIFLMSLGVDTHSNMLCFMLHCQVHRQLFPLMPGNALIYFEKIDITGHHASHKWDYLWTLSLQIMTQTY